MDAAYTAVHIEEDRRHWYFQGHLAVLLACLRRVLPPRRVRILEMGCGTGNVLAALGAFGETVGMEVSPGSCSRRSSACGRGSGGAATRVTICAAPRAS